MWYERVLFLHLIFGETTPFGGFIDRDQTKRMYIYFSNPSNTILPIAVPDLLFR
ncbi:hypothetical protein SAMN05518670_5333 [Paenibacillus sp. OK076]|nr:hypothetical protein SAMN05518670_5333 [Paenibacillus sp. OK076]